MLEVSVEEDVCWQLQLSASATALYTHRHVDLSSVTIQSDYSSPLPRPARSPVTGQSVTLT